VTIPAIRSFAFWSASLLAAAATAQAPDGWLLVSSFRWFGNHPCSVAGPAGLHYLDPRTGAMQPVTGLPADVAGTVPGSTLFHGADFVLRIPDTDLLLASAWGDATVGQQMGMYVMRMRGSAVAATTRHDLGVVAPAAVNGGGLAQAQALRDGRALCVVDPTCFHPAWPLSATMLAVVDPFAPPGSTNAVSLVPSTPLPPGNPNALALDERQGLVWVGVYVPGIAGFDGSRIYSVPWPLGGAPVLQFSFPGVLVTALALDNSGALLVAGWDLATGAASLRRIGPAASVPFAQLAGLLYLENVRLDPVTGDLYLIAAPACGTRAVYRLSPGDPAAGVLAQIGVGPAGGWGVASGLDLDPDPEAYGQRSGLSPLDVQWALAPNAGGLPLVGNMAFGLELAAPSVPTLAGVVLGFARTSTPLAFPPVQMLVVPAVGQLLVPAPLMPVPLGIPNNPALRGLSLFGQGIWLDPGALWGATAGVHLTVL
jgi:hypothetical protein